MSDIRDFLLPDLGEGLEEGEVVSWAVAVGDHIALNDTVAEIETAKAVVAVPSPFEGTVVKLFGEVGDVLEVGKPLVSIDTSGGAAAPVAAQASDGQPSMLDEVETVEAPAGASAEDAGSAARKSVLDADEEPQPLVGYGNKGAAGRRKRRGRNDAAVVAEPVVREGRPLAKPPVRKLAKDLGIDLEDVAGSGPDGVITREDLEAFADGGAAVVAAAAPVAAPVVAASPAPAQAAPEPTTAVAPAPAPIFSGSAGEKAVPGFRGRVPGEVEQIRGIRGKIVAKMETSRREIPEATASRDADLTELWEVRKDLTRAAREDGFDVKITPFALIMRATVLALRRFPTLNGRIDTEAGEIRLIEHINLGFAADTDRGLMVPNIKDAHAKSTLQIAMELNDLATKARNGSVTAGELTGGTFTVSNYGAFGNDSGNPIINHPEGAILGVGAIRERPWVVDGQIAVRRICTFSLAFDHRISDGGEAGRFVTYVADLCENPSRILLHS